VDGAEDAQDRILWRRELGRRRTALKSPHINILLHVWGFLGDVTWALSRNSSVVHCYVSLATQQFKRRAYQQHCYARNNRHRRFYVLRNSTDIVSRVWKSPSADVLVCLATDSFWLEDSSYPEIAREAREFIRWTVKTVDRRG
jgi:hypothetical protein